MHCVRSRARLRVGPEFELKAHICRFRSWCRPAAAPCCWRSRYRHLSEISSLNGIRDGYDAPVTHASTTTSDDLRPQAGRSFNLAVIGGDGIGPEVVAEGLKVLDAIAGPGVFTPTTYDLGASRWQRTGEVLPEPCWPSSPPPT